MVQGEPTNFGLSQIALKRPKKAQTVKNIKKAKRGQKAKKAKKGQKP